MPASGPVYQPTTVGYEDQNQWASPGGFFSQGIRTKYTLYIISALGLIALASGLVMIIAASVDMGDIKAHDAEIGATTEVEEKEYTTDVLVIVIGVLLLVAGLLCLGFYLFVAYRRRVFPCMLTKDQRMARALRSQQSSNGQAMNPSTDLLVAAQYAPVSEIAYHPPAVSEEEETRKLMGSDNKDCSSDDSERILDKDPRIVLRPLSKVEESQDSEGAF